MVAAFVIGLGLLRDPLSLTLSFERSPPGRSGECGGRVTVTNFARVGGSAPDRDVRGGTGARGRVPARIRILAGTGYLRAPHRLRVPNVMKHRALRAKIGDERMTAQAYVIWPSRHKVSRAGRSRFQRWCLGCDPGAGQEGGRNARDPHAPARSHPRKRAPAHVPARRRFGRNPGARFEYPMYSGLARVLAHGFVARLANMLYMAALARALSQIVTAQARFITLGL